MVVNCCFFGYRTLSALHSAFFPSHVCWPLIDLHLAYLRQTMKVASVTMFGLERCANCLCLGLQDGGGTMLTDGRSRRVCRHWRAVKFIGTQRRSEYLHLILDRFFKVTETVTMNGISDTEVAKNFINKCVFNYDPPKDVLADNGWCFTARSSKASARCSSCKIRPGRAVIPKLMGSQNDSTIRSWRWLEVIARIIRTTSTTILEC